MLADGGVKNSSMLPSQSLSTPSQISIPLFVIVHLVVGAWSGPGVHPHPGGAIGPSLTPSPSVSGLFGFVTKPSFPGFNSSQFVNPSPSESLKSFWHPAVQHWPSELDVQAFVEPHIWPVPQLNTPPFCCHVCKLIFKVPNFVSPLPWHQIWVPIAVHVKDAVFPFHVGEALQV